ncbi:ribonuclease H-like domain-containing protein [Tanacetum coccineum]
MVVGEPYRSVELINNLDTGLPLYLQSNDNSSLAIINVKLVGAENYKIVVLSQQWEICNAIVYVGQVYSEIASEFLMGLNDVYQPIRSTILAKDPLPNIKNAFYVVSREESHKGLHPGGLISLNLLLLLIGHTVDRCYELIGYLAGFKRNPNLSKQYGNNNKRFNANTEINHSVPSTSGSLSSSFTNEQMMKLLSFINEKPSNSINMSDMFNVVDISSLMLIVGHPNGTLAKITAIGSLRLTSGIVMFDVLVVPEYNDLNMSKIMRTGSESGGLYLFDIDKIGFSKKDHMSHCDICHKAKQIRELFSLSDHKSKFVGDIIHCDVWGPYMVVSKDGYKFFLTLVDDFSRTVWVYMLKSKSEVGEYIESLIKLIFTQFGKKVKLIRSDNGTEFVNNQLSNMFNELDTINQTSCAYTPQQNGIVKRKHRHLLNVARSLMSEKCVLIGFSSVKKACKLYGLDSKNVFYSRDVKFYENIFPFKMRFSNDSSNVFDKNNKYVNGLGESEENSLNFFDVQNPKRPYDEEGHSSNMEGNNWVTSDDCDNTVKDEVINVATQIGENVTSEGNVQTNQNGEGPSNALETSPVLRRSTRQRGLPSKFNDYVVSSDVKYDLEKYALHRNNTYVLTDLPPGRKAIGCKWILKIKYKSASKIDRKLCLELLSEYVLLACKPAATPLQQNVVLNHEEYDNDKFFLPNIKIVGKLIYLSITRPDISYTVHCLSQHMHAPFQSHFTVAVRVLRYLKNALGTGVQFYKGKGLNLHAFSDADWAKCPKTGKSSAESEYRCLTTTTCELTWVIKFLKDLEVDGLLPAYLYCDSSFAISITGNPVFHEKTKHFEIDLHLVKEKVSYGVVKVLKVASTSNVADIFTKGLSIAQHTEFCKRLRLVDMFKP